MKRKKVVAIISAVFISVSLGMIGCSKENVEINNNLTVSKENVSNKSTLKIKEKEEIVLNSPLVDNNYSLKFNENNELLVEQIDETVDQNLALYGKINVEEGNVALEYLESIKYNNISNSAIQFYVESISDNKVKIRNSLSDKGYEIDSDIISNESSKYSLDGNMLFEYVLDDTGMIGRVVWRNLENNEEGTIEKTEDYKTLIGANLLGDKIIISAISNNDNITMPNNLLIVNLEKNEIEEEILVGTFGFIIPIDEERVILLSAVGNDSTLKIYNVKTKKENEFFRYTYSSSEDDGAVNISYVGLFPSKDKFYYCEYTNETAYIKVAKIKGMEIEQPVTLCELNISEEYISEPPTVVIGNDEKEVIVYYNNASIGGIEKFYKIKLNK